MDGAGCGRDVVVTCCVPLHKQLLQHIWLKCFAGGCSQCKYDEVLVESATIVMLSQFGCLPLHEQPGSISVTCNFAHVIVSSISGLKLRVVTLSCISRLRSLEPWLSMGRLLLLLNFLRLWISRSAQLSKSRRLLKPSWCVCCLPVHAAVCSCSCLCKRDENQVGSTIDLIGLDFNDLELGPLFFSSRQLFCW